MGTQADRPAGDDIIPQNAPCPFCDGTDTKLLNPFGGQLSMAQYWCNRCRTGFEYIKWEEHEDERRD
jgi:C4-type Zn-finger protein